MEKRILIKPKKIGFLIFLLFTLLSNNICSFEIPIKILKTSKNINKKILPKTEKIELNKSSPISLKYDTDIEISKIYIFCKISIGSPEQQFNLLLDSNSYELVAIELGSVNNSSIPNQFNPNKSTTFQKGKKFVYKEKLLKCSGVDAIETFKFIDNKKFKMSFVLCNYSAFEDWEDLEGLDGIIGLGKYPKEKKNFSIINQLKNNGIIDSLAFSIRLNSYDRGDKGKIYFGRHEGFLKDDTLMVPLSSGYWNKYWTIQINGFGLKNSKNEKIFNKDFISIFQISSVETVLPMYFFEQIKDNLEEFGCKGKENKDISVIKCETKSEDNHYFILKISQKKLIIPIKDKDIDRISFIDEGYDDGIYKIGYRFFCSFHTLFDDENKIIQIKAINDGKITDNVEVVIIIIISCSVLLVVLIVVGILIYWFKFRKKESPHSIEDSRNFDLLHNSKSENSGNSSIGEKNVD